MTRIRKSMLSMQPSEWQTYNSAINTLIASGGWNVLYMNHGDRTANHRMHGALAGPVGYDRFLHWHRAYVIECENALREVSPDITIPYWDWLGSDTIPAGLDHQPIRGVVRNAGPVTFTDSTELARIMASDTFDAFVRDLENNPHNRGHNWVGGIMTNPWDSPMDPLFYMHHAFIDKLFSEWQAKPGNAAKKPGAEGNDARLDPWGEKWTIDNVHAISDLGDDSYSYAPAAPEALVAPGIADMLRRLDQRRWPDPMPTPPIWPPSWPPVPEPTPGPWPGPRPSWDNSLSRDEIGLIQFMRTRGPR